MRKKFFYLVYFIIFFTCSTQFAQFKEQAKLNNREKQFIAAKISKIQADYDNLTKFHKTYENDSLIYPERRSLLDFYDGLGRNCFGLNPDNKVQTYDIITERIKIDSTFNNSFTIFHSFMSDIGKQYFLAVDDSGKVFLLHNFWCDEFNKFVLKKFGIIDNKEKAFFVIRIFIATKLYSPYNREKIIITKDNIKKYNSKYPYLQPIKILDNSKNGFDLTFYTYSPYSGEIIYFHFIVSRNGGITFNQKIENESTITD